MTNLVMTTKLHHYRKATRLDFFGWAGYGRLFLRKAHMKKLPAVETAKELMTEAMSWSVMKWLREKQKVRKAADEANAALDQLSETVQARWTEGAREAYAALVAQPAGERKGRSQPDPAQALDSDAKLIAKKVKEADDEAYRARQDAENTFDEAERQMSTSLAREGCRKAIHGWELHEKAIQKAEAVIRPHE